MNGRLVARGLRGLLASHVPQPGLQRTIRGVAQLHAGSDLGEAIKGFRSSIGDKEEDADPFEQNKDNVIDGKAEELKENGK